MSENRKECYDCDYYYECYLRAVYGSVYCNYLRRRKNEDWNNSAPHGAGRIMSRNKAKETFKLEEFKESMKDVYSTSVVEETIS